MAEAVLAAEGLWKSYGAGPAVLRDAALRVPAREAAIVWGDNGSGKTTLLSILGGLDAPDQGSVRIGDREIVGLKERDLARVRLHEVGFVWQTHRLLEDLSVRDNVALPLRLAKKPAEPRVSELLESFALTKLADRRPAQVSVGESQRVAVARALANGPKVILADEPTAALDSKGTTAVLEAFERARSSFGVALVVATHDPHVDGLRGTAYELADGALRPRVV